MKPPKEPKPLMNRRIREWDLGPFCKLCGSSFHKKYIFFRTDKCVQPMCDNYYEKTSTTGVQGDPGIQGEKLT